MKQLQELESEVFDARRGAGHVRAESNTLRDERQAADRLLSLNK
jgi:hypothetical protein